MNEGGTSIFGFSTPALILIGVIALVILGPGKLPEPNLPVSNVEGYGKQVVLTVSE
jgi:hypothetical protein